MEAHRRHRRSRKLLRDLSWKKISLDKITFNPVLPCIMPPVSLGMFWNSFNFCVFVYKSRTAVRIIAEVKA